MNPIPAPVLAAGIAATAGAVSAGTLSCTMADPDCPTCPPVTISFFVDPTLNDRVSDVRRAAIMVDFGDIRFGATPIVMPGAGIRGFHADAGAMGERLMVVQRDGEARYTETPSSLTLTGKCRDN